MSKSEGFVVGGIDLGEHRTPGMVEVLVQTQDLDNEIHRMNLNQVK